MSREDFTSPFRDGLKNSTFGGFSSLIKRRNCHGTPAFCVFHGSFLCAQGRTTRGQSPCFLPEDEQITTMLIAEIRQSPSRCHAEGLWRQRDNTFDRGRPIWGKRNLAQGKRSQSGVSPWVYGSPPLSRPTGARGNIGHHRA